MQLDQLALRLRPRNGWESLDLGLAMFQRWRGPALRALLSTYWPFTLLVSTLLWNHPDIAILIIWWCKPFFDRILLFVFSRAVFNEIPTVREVWRDIPNLFKRTSLIAALTFYRFSPSRSFFLPIWQLEGQRGKAARQRRHVLGHKTTGYAWSLTFFLVNFNLILLCSCWLIGLMFIPRETINDEWHFFSYLFDEDTSNLWLAHLSNLLILLIDTLIEPIYVASGFSLYLNRRSELEGWDIEVAFRRMTERVERQRSELAARVKTTSAHQSNTQPLALLLITCCAWFVAPPEVSAQANDNLPSAQEVNPLPNAPEATVPLTDPEGQTTNATAAPASTPTTATGFVYEQPELKARLKTILTDPVFGKVEQEWRWQYRGQSESSARTRDLETPWWYHLAEGFKDLLEAFAIGLRAVIWAGLLIALTLAVYLVMRAQGKLPWQKTAQRRVPEQLFGLDIRPDSLPDDITASARRLLAEQQLIAALSLLYRASLSALIHHAAVEFEPGDTEENCWQRAQPVLSTPALAYFRALLDAWLVTVYAHRPPALQHLEQLCDQWPSHFQAEQMRSKQPPQPMSEAT